MTLAANAPLAEGVKITLIVHWAPAATLDPQLLLSAKALGLVPVSAMLAMLRAALPLLLKVKLWAALVVPTAWVPNARLLADRVAEGCGSTPVPDNEMPRRARSLLAISIWPVTLPMAVGAKVTYRVVVESTAKVASDVNPLRLKLDPCTVATTIVGIPVFSRVTTWVLMVPTATFPKLRLAVLKVSCDCAAAHLAKQMTASQKNTKRAGW